MRIAYFTAGTHGAGHLVRGLAILRALRRCGSRAEYRLFAPPSSFAWIASDVHHPVTIDPRELRDPARAPDSSLARAIHAYAPDVLVVDLFWVPLVFVPLPCPVWLLLRSVPPVWLVGPEEARFEASRYARVFAIEPAPGLETFESIPPVVVANRDEARTRDELCALLGARADAPLHLLARGGMPSDLGPLSSVVSADGAQVHDLDLTRHDAPFPLAPWLAGMEDQDTLVAAPGYNTWWESHWLGFAPRVTWVPMQRTFDDARWRATCVPARGWVDNGADVLATRLVRG